MSAFYRVPPELHRSVCDALLSDEFNINPEAEAPGPFLGLGTRTVAILARTSRWFYGPAMDALWRTIPNVAVLLHTMPENCYTQTRIGNYTRFAFTRPLHDSDFTRFHTYSLRIRALANCAHLSNKVARYFIAAKALQELATFAHAHGWLILPNLLKLEYWHSPCSFTILRVLHRLCRPQLRSFALRTFPLALLKRPPTDLQLYSLIPQGDNDMEEVVMGILKRVQAICPDLHDFSVAVDEDSKPLVKAVLDTAMSFRHLTSFRCGSTTLPISIPALIHLALLPNLEVLTFSTDRVSWFQSDFLLLDIKPRSAVFPAIRDIAMLSTTLEVPMKILSYISSRHFTTLNVKVLKPVPRKNLIPFFNAIRGRWQQPRRRESLKNISISMDVVRSDGSDAPPDPIRLTTIDSILCLRGIRILHLDILCPWDVDDDFLFEVAECLPHLAALNLGAERPWHAHAQEKSDLLTYRPPATLEGLLEFARECLNLRNLGVEFDTDIRVPLSQPGMFRPPFPGARGCALEHLSVGFSRIDVGPGGDDAMDVALAGQLSNLFPDLQTFDSCWLDLYDADQEREAARRVREGDAYKEDATVAARMDACWRQGMAWTTVQRTIQEFSLVRSQEQRWYIENVLPNKPKAKNGRNPNPIGFPSREERVSEGSDGSDAMDQYTDFLFDI
ncbi:hypothetical protein V8D89_011370 [Ganoderma adspersum]